MSVFRHGRQLVVISHIRTLYTFVVGVVVVVTSELSGKNDPYFVQRTLTYFESGTITLQLTSCFAHAELIRYLLFWLNPN